MQLIMPKQISGEIMTLIDEADKKVVLVTPYFKVKSWYKMLNTFNSLKNRPHVIVDFFLREGEDESIKEARDAGFRPNTIPNLHTKLYMNERVGIVSSMNLLLSSDTNSLDIALKTENQKEYDELWGYYTRYISKPLVEIQSNYDWHRDMKSRLSKSYGERLYIEEEPNKLIIQTRNRYEAFIERDRGAELRISGILSAKEFDYATKHSRKIAMTGMQTEYVQGGSGYYNTVWGIAGGLKTYRISEPLAAEAPAIVNMIVGFIDSVEQLKGSLNKG